MDTKDDQKLTLWKFLTVRLSAHDLCDLLCELGEDIEQYMVDKIVDGFSPYTVLAKLEGMGYKIDKVLIE